jgi:hypothetical protein
MLYAADPWAVIEGSITQRLAAGPDRRAAHSFARQAREYFSASDRATAIETRPLLYYYSFLNLSKALALTHGRSRVVGPVFHGIQPVGNTGHTPASSVLALSQSTGKRVSAPDELHLVIEHSKLLSGPVAVQELLAQSVVGHRLWCEAANRKERFLACEQIRFMHDEHAKEVWATLSIRADTMKSQQRGIKETLAEAALTPNFRAVADHHVVDGTIYRIFEQTAANKYAARPSDVVMSVVAQLRPYLWRTVMSDRPYRRYYLYLSPPHERRVTQWLSTYAVLFWLGSMTRYQPVELLELLDGPYGAFIREFLATQPAQLLYLLTSEFKQQEVTRAAVV